MKANQITNTHCCRFLNITTLITGLAYIDVYNLKPENVNKGIDGKLWIRAYRQKTDGKSQIPLLPKAIEILNFHKEHPTVCLPIKDLMHFLKETADLTDVTKKPNSSFSQAYIYDYHLLRKRNFIRNHGQE